MVVKEIDRRQIMLVSYWDAGYVKLDVTDPTKATYIADSEFAAVDPQLLEQAKLSEAPEGNAHEAEFTKDNATTSSRPTRTSAPTGLRGETDDGGLFVAATGSGTPDLHDGDSISGVTRYVGRACPGDVAVPGGDEGTIAVVSRGMCTFTEKIAAVAAAGYAAAIVVNREGFDGCGPFGMSVDGDIPAFSIERSAGFGLFDKQADYDNAACLAGAEEFIPEVGIGQSGDMVTLESFFDGWGYVHLFKNEADATRSSSSSTPSQSRRR